MKVKSSDQILDELTIMFPNAKTELNYQDGYQLLVAVMLSAQSTDVVVNQITPNLFKAYPTFYDLSLATSEAVAKIIKRIGLYKTKAKNLVAMAQIIVTQFDSKLEGAIGEYEDGKKIAGDIPAYLAVGVGYSPVDAVRVNVGFHWFDDKNATSYKNRNKELKRGTLEYNAGVEVDVNKKITLSTGWQNTNYGLSDEYMDDKSFVVSSNSVAVGGVYHINKKMDLNVAYFHTFYQHKKTSEKVEQIGKTYGSDYTRNNNVFAVGLDINF